MNFLTPTEWAILGLSLKVSLVAIGLTMPVAYALAWLLARRRFPGRMLLDALVHLPLVVPPVVTGWLLLVVFGRQGPVGSVLQDWFGLSLTFRWQGAALAASVMALPLMVRAMRLSIEAVDRRLVGAARSLGASRWRAFLTITLPLSLPGILAGAVVRVAIIHLRFLVAILADDRNVREVGADAAWVLGDDRSNGVHWRCSCPALLDHVDLTGTEAGRKPLARTLQFADEVFGIHRNTEQQHDEHHQRSSAVL